MPDPKVPQGARGGNAIAAGQDTVARGGNAGPLGAHPGGRGGDATTSIPNKTVIGGDGGRGGVIPGMAGADVDDEGGVGDLVAGGHGGEADQPDGRGGRGGRSPGYELLCKADNITPRPNMKRPYWPDANFEPGRGGDRPDTPQYRARRLTVEIIKADLAFAPAYFTTELWYDREAISEARINEELERRACGWRIKIVDHEYNMVDLDEWRLSMAVSAVGPEAV